MIKFILTIQLFLWIGISTIHAQWMRLELISIHCIKTEGQVFNDNIYIKVNGDKVWQSTMAAGQKKSLRNVGSKSFKGTIKIEVWDDDTFDPDDHIGTFEAELIDIGKERTQPLKYGTADYKLTYKVVLDY